MKVITQDICWKSNHMIRGSQTKSHLTSCERSCQSFFVMKETNLVIDCNIIWCHFSETSEISIIVFTGDILRKNEIVDYIIIYVLALISQLFFIR